MYNSKHDEGIVMMLH